MPLTGREIIRRVTRFDIITFDCYGTLIDWESGIRKAFIRTSCEDGVTLNEEQIIDTYKRVEPAVQRAAYKRYRDILGEAADETARALGWRVNYTGFLADSLAAWRPFPDTNSALERLAAAGHKLGILSNIDVDLLAMTRKHFTVEFDLIITAEDVASYKPGPMHFLVARERIGSDRWLHAAQSNFHDIVPANALGIQNAWINRRGEKALPGGSPTFEYRDLKGLADAMT
jgi:2-haloalkanoic acid dehalogenase type II